MSFGENYVGKKERFTFSSIRLNSCSWNDLNQKCGLGLFETLLCCVEFKNFLICIFCDFVWIRARADEWIERKLKSPWRQILSIHSKLALNWQKKIFGFWNLQSLKKIVKKSAIQVCLKEWMKRPQKESASGPV